ncbi:hypothetical protein Syun_006995 [Stephania yunnanensis]|uniref:Uncharacterized protein n=1 Tax=Stephania yunnanensis TaxID=152371 RepID=A0AAP0KZE1_9MAGN
MYQVLGCARKMGTSSEDDCNRLIVDESFKLLVIINQSPASTPYPAVTTATVSGGYAIASNPRGCR